MAEDLLAGLHIPKDANASRVSARRDEFAVGATIVVDVRSGT